MPKREESSPGRISGEKSDRSRPKAALIRGAAFLVAVELAAESVGQAGTEPQNRIAASLHCGYAVGMSDQGFHGFLTVQGRGTVALPPALRARYQLDTPGAQVELTERADGVLELRPVVPVPASEAWFWEDRWQAGERHVDELVAAGQVTVFAGPDEFMDDLDATAPTK